jgi:hypothetical protein
MRCRAIAFAAAVLASLVPGCASSQSALPECTATDEPILILTAQAVPSATRLPCISTLPAGWGFGGWLIRSDLARFWLDSDVAGYHAVEMDLTADCDTSEAVEVPPSPDEAGTRVFEEPASLPPRFSGRRYVVFPGGCLTTVYRFAPNAPATLALEADAAVGLLARSVIVREVRDEFGLSLCGAGAPPCIS